MLNKKASGKHTLSRQSILNLFLICIFPIHFWSILIFLQHVSWLGKYGNGIVFGIFSYFLLIALLESIGVFLLVFIVERLLHFNFPETIKLAFLGLTAWSICIGMMMAQFINLGDLDQKALWLLVVIFISLLILLIYRLLKIQTFANLAEDILGRVVVLSALFLGLDLLALSNILIRNIF